MHEARGIGLAAQQVGRAVQLCVIDLRVAEADFDWKLDGAKTAAGALHAHGGREPEADGRAEDPDGRLRGGLPLVPRDPRRRGARRRRLGQSSRTRPAFRTSSSARASSPGACCTRSTT